jgi:uncharacterized membrane protein HdeD (DUF308 family)
MFKKYQNENQTDRVIRLVLGIVLALTGYVYFSGPLQVVLYVLAFIALFTSITGFCLIYKLLGISTLKKV